MAGAWGEPSGPGCADGLMFPPRCTLHPSDQLALEGPLSRVKSLKKSLRQSFRRMRRSRVASQKRRPVGSPGEVRPPGRAGGCQQRAGLPLLPLALAASTGPGPTDRFTSCPLPTSYVASVLSHCSSVPQLPHL